MRLIAESRERLDKFLARQLPGHTRSRLQRLIDAGGVLVQGEVAEKTGMELREGWTVDFDEPEETPPHDLAPADIPLDVRFEDESLLVVNKPRGLATHPAVSLREPTLVNALLWRSHSLSQGSAPYRPGIVHRLDKETTGLIMIAKTDAAHAKLSRQIEEKSAQRVYVVVVQGEALEDAFTIDAAIGRHPTNPTLMAVKKSGKPAKTHVRVLAQVGGDSVLACKLETGRTHQIRVHLAACHLPVVGDSLYSPDGVSEGPMQLHAALLSFDHPASGERTTLYAEPPQDFQYRDEVTRGAVEAWE